MSLTSLATVTRRPVLQKVRRHTLTVLRLFVGIRFQVLFHSPPGVLFTFPSRYWSTIGRQGVFSLGRWSSLIPTEFHVLRGTWVASGSPRFFGYEPFTLCGGPFQTASPKARVFHSLEHLPLLLDAPATPCVQRQQAFAHARFGLFPFRSPLLRESSFLSFPQGTKMFQFPWLPLLTYVFSQQ